jgi:hypothetical protein
LETDFVSVASNSDSDFYSFTVSAPTLLNVSLTPLGGVFSQAAEGGAQSTFDANSRNDLSLAVFASNGSTLLGSANLTGAGGREVLSELQLTSAGTYFVRIRGSSTSVQLYELEISAALLSLALPGDYNGDGVVNAADYVVWRNTLGQSGANLGADGNGDGIINLADFNLWKANFGKLSGATSALYASVPEPRANMLLSIGALSAMIQLALVARESRVT